MGNAAMLYTIARNVWKIIKWVTGSIIAVLIGYAANVLVLRTEDIGSTAFVSLVNWLFLAGFNRTLTLSILILLFIITLLAGVFTAIGNHAEERKKTPKIVIEDRATALESQNRQRLLAKVHTFWIKDVLDQSLHGAALIVLGLREQPDAVENPWRLVFQETNQPARLLPPGTRIKQVYDDASGELLILGEPGSGKTTLLLELARDLLDRAQNYDTHPMPVVFILSSWAAKQQPLTDWLVEELNTKYLVPHKLGQLWVDSDQLLLLFDGLDEVSPASRVKCVDAINAYRQEHGLVPIIISSRSAEYFTITKISRLQLRNAVTVEPLTAQQVDDYLSSAGGQLAAVRIALRHDQVLQELATTPLMLSVLTLAYHGKSVSDIVKAGSLEAGRQQVFESYIEKMLQRRGRKTRFTTQQTRYRLAWLARQLVKHSQTVFYIEQLQADWLPASWARLVYHVLTGLIFGVVVFLVLGAIAGLIVGLGVGLRGGLILGVVVGLIGGLGVGLRGGPDSAIQPTEAITWSFESFRNGFLFRLQRGLRERLIVGLFFGMLVGLIAGLILGVIGGLGVGLRGGVIILLIVLLIVLLRGGPDSAIQPTGGITGLFESFRNGFLFMLRGGLIGGLRGGLIGGLLSKTLDEDKRSTPNQGTWRSVRYAGVTALIFGSIFGPIFALIGALIFGPSEALTFVLSGVLSSALSGALIFGGEACTKHFILRLLLCQAGTVPWNYPRFLDHAVERILLRKVGGGYIFIHRSLMEHFATLWRV